MGLQSVVPNAASTPESPEVAKRKVPAWILWSRGIGAVSILLGGAGLIQPQTFWIGVGFIYGGFLLLGADLYFEPQLPRSFKVIGGMMLISLLVLFSWLEVFVSAPIKLLGLTDATVYRSDRTVAGIAWRPMFVEVDLIFNNPTDDNYDDMNVVIKPDTPIAAIAQLSNLGDVSFEDFWGVTAKMNIQGSDSSVAVPLAFLATDAGYRIHCGRIPPHNSLRIVAAAVSIKKTEPMNQSNIQRMLEDKSLSGFAVEQTFDDKILGRGSYWYGSTENPSMFGPQPKPAKVTVNGVYVAKNRRFRLKNEIIALGNFGG